MFVLHLWVGEDSRGDRDPINNGWWGRRSLGLGNSYGKMKEKNIQPEEGKIFFIVTKTTIPKFGKILYIINWEIEKLVELIHVL